MVISSASGQSHPFVRSGRSASEVRPNLLGGVGKEKRRCLSILAKIKWEAGRRMTLTLQFANCLDPGRKIRNPSLLLLRWRGEATPLLRKLASALRILGSKLKTYGERGKHATPATAKLKFTVAAALTYYTRLASPPMYACLYLPATD